MPEVAVAIPVRDGGGQLRGVLDALARQTVAHELIICDSGSSDGSSELARRYGARVLEIPAQSFNHGATRNLLVREADAAHVALLSQDAQPADERWLERLLGAFELSRDVAIAFGPYRPRPGCSPATRLELERWFASLSPDGGPVLERLAEGERALPAAALVGRRGFFTDANACLARDAWQRVPFREVAYAEDRVLALEMLRAGYAKAYIPDAAVLHSHEYSAPTLFRRSFDEWRALREVYDWRESARPGYLLAQLRGELAWARREPSIAELAPLRRAVVLAAVSRHHLVRLAGAVLGSRADSLPRWARRAISLERRASFDPMHLDASSDRSQRGAPPQ